MAHPELCSNIANHATPTLCNFFTIFAFEILYLGCYIATPHAISSKKLTQEITQDLRRQTWNGNMVLV